MNLKAIYALLVVFNASVLGYFIYNEDTFPFSNLILFCIALVIFENLAYSYAKGEKPGIFPVLFSIICFVGIYETLFINRGVVLNTFIVASIVLVILFIVKWTFFYDRKEYNPFFTTIIILLLYFVLNSKLYIMSAFTVLVPLQVYRNFSYYTDLKSSMPSLGLEKKLLDIDAGNGVFLYTINNETGCSVMGVDENPEQVKYANLYTDAKMFKGSIKQVNIGERFDVVTAWRFSEKHYDPRSFISSCSEILTDKGYLVVSLKDDSMQDELSRTLARYDFEVQSTEQISIPTIHAAVKSQGAKTHISRIVLGFNPEPRLLNLFYNLGAVMFPKKEKITIITAKRIKNKTITDILRVGCRAMSHYNLQPWRFRIKDDRVLVYILKEGSILAASSYNVYCICLGSLLQNMYEGAKHYGFNMSYRLLDDKFRIQEPAAEVVFSRDPSPEEHSIRSVLKRYTNRKLYYSKPVPKEVIEHIRSSYASGSARIIQIADKERFAEAYSDLERIRFLNDRLMSDVHNNFRYIPEKSLRHRDLLDIRTAETSYANRLILRYYGNPVLRSIVKVLKYVKVDKKAKEYHKNLVINSGANLIFTEQKWDYSKLVRDGERLQRICNYIFSKGLHSHMIVSSMDLLRMPEDIYTEKEYRMLKNAEKELRDLLGVDLNFVIMVMRLGYSDECRIKSLRKDIHDLLL